MSFVPRERHLLRARDFVDFHYSESVGVDEMAAAAGLSRAHFSREFKRVFGQPPIKYLLERRLERAASLLRHTDMPVNAICYSVGFVSVGTFTSRFRGSYGHSPTACRALHPPATIYARVPTCVLKNYGRISNSTNEEASSAAAP